MDFPALAPATRVFTPAESIYTAYTSMSGEQSRIQHSSLEVEGSLELTFVRLSPTDRNAIEHHYRQQFGEFFPFHLSPDVFSGFTPLELDPYGLWRYAKPPEVEDHCGPTATVQVTLRTAAGGAPGAQLPPVQLAIVADGAGPGGLDGAIDATIEGGAATGA